MNLVRHRKSKPSEGKSRCWRAAWQGLRSSSRAELNSATQLSDFKRRATAMLKSNLTLQFSSASISTTFGLCSRHSLC